MNVPGITGQADAKLKESHHLFQHGLGVNLSSRVMDLSFAYGPSRTSRQKIKKQVLWGRKSLADGEGAGKCMQNESGSMERLFSLGLQRQEASLVHPPKCPFFISACENLVQTVGDKCQDSWLRQEKPFGSSVPCWSGPRPPFTVLSLSDPTPKSYLWLPPWKWILSRQRLYKGRLWECRDLLMDLLKNNRRGFFERGGEMLWASSSLVLWTEPCRIEESIEWPLGSSPPALVTRKEMLR